MKGYMRLFCYLLFVFLLSFSFISCETEANIKLPETSPKLVVISYISPQDTMIRVRVTLSIPIFGKVDPSNGAGQIEAVKDASVKISNGSSSFSLSFDAKSGQYIADSSLIKIDAGKTYYLDVSTQDGLKVTAKCTVPRQNNTVTIESVDSPKLGDEKRYVAIFRWEDNTEEVNYYRIWGALHSKYKLLSVFEFNEEGEFVSDAEVSSIVYRRKGEYSTYSETYFDEISGYLITTDIHYYKYHKSLINENLTDIFSDPILIYSNIEGGYGVFCAYNKSMKAVLNL